MEIADFIKKIEQEYDDLQVGILKPDSSFKETINWSSINSVVFSTMIEFEYGVMVTADDFKNVNTLGELFALVMDKKQANGSS